MFIERGQRPFTAGMTHGIIVMIPGTEKEGRVCQQADAWGLGGPVRLTPVVLNDVAKMYRRHNIQRGPVRLNPRALGRKNGGAQVLAVGNDNDPDRVGLERLGSRRE